MKVWGQGGGERGWARSGEGRRVLARSVPSSLPSGSLWSSMVPRSPVPGEDSRYFYPLCILLPVFENTVLSNTGWSKALLSQRRDGTRSASNSGCGSPLAIRSLSVVDTGQLAYVDSSVLPWEEPVPSPHPSAPSPPLLPTSPSSYPCISVKNKREKEVDESRKRREERLIFIGFQTAISSIKLYIYMVLKKTSIFLYLDTLIIK